MSPRPVHCPDLAIRRAAVALVIVLHLVWLPGARALTLDSALASALPWLGIGPALLLLAGAWRGPAVAVSAALIGVGSARALWAGGDVAPLVVTLSVLVPLFLVGASRAGDRLSWDAWRELGREDLEELQVALRRPFEITGAGAPLAHPALAGFAALLLLVTASRSVVPPASVGEETTALSRALLAFVLVFPFGSVHARLARRTRIVVLYDEACHFCSRTLQWMRALDPAGIWVLRSDRDLPADLAEHDDLDRRDAMFTVEGERIERGYHAVRHLFTPYPTLAPLVAVLGWPAVAALGERAYAIVARKRAQWFTCASAPRAR